MWIAADFTNKVNCFHLYNYRNDIYDLEPLGEESVGEALFALADTPRKLYVGTTSAVVSLDKQTLKTEVLFHQKELFTHNYNTLLLDSKNRLWFASDDGCVAYVIDEGRFETYRISLKKQVRSQKSWSMSSMKIERETFGSEHMATGFSCWIRKSVCFVCILLKAYCREKISECWAKLLPGIY